MALILLFVVPIVLFTSVGIGLVAVVGWLVPLEGLQAGELFQLNKARNVVGTAADCDVVLTDPTVSRRHPVP